jgi:hypothetical protein
VHVKDFNFKDGIGMFLPAQEFVDTHGGTLAVSHAVNDQAWAKNTIASGKDAGD